MHDLEASDACRSTRYPTHVMATRHPRRAKPDLTEQARRAGVRLVRFLYTDNGGITRGKATHVDGLAHRLTDGIGLTVAMQAMNLLEQLQPVEGRAPVGEIGLVPDPQTFTVLPYAPHAAAMTTDMRTLEGAPWEACPRAFLKRQIAACAAGGFRAGDARHRGRARGAAHSGRAVLPGAGPRPAGAVDRACAGARSRRPPGLLSGDGAGRRPPSRALGLARAHAAPA